NAVKVPHRRAARWEAVALASVVTLGALGLTISYPLWRSPGRKTQVPGPSGPPAGGNQTQAAVAAPSPAPLKTARPPRTLVLQGRPAVRDALIDFSEPDRSFGSSARDNAVRRAEQCDALLLHFDLSKLDIPPQARISSATASFFVWDP